MPGVARAANINYSLFLCALVTRRDITMIKMCPASPEKSATATRSTRSVPACEWKRLGVISAREKSNSSGTIVNENEITL